jgi:hypothetical protein
VDVAASSATAPAVAAELDFFVTVTSKNAGGSSDARLDLTLPAGYSVTRTYADRGPGCTGTAPTLICDVAWINASTGTHVQIFGTVGQAGEQDLTATVTSLVEREFNPADNTATLKLLPLTTQPAGGGGGTRHRAPAALKPPTVTGKPRVGSVLHASPATWTFRPDRVTYQWQLCTAKGCRSIAGATKPTLRLTGADVGKRLRVVETASTGNATVTSSSLSVAIRKH